MSELAATTPALRGPETAEATETASTPPDEPDDLGRVEPLSRKQARRQALIILYQWDVTGREPGTLAEGDVDPYAKGLVEAVLEAVLEIDEVVDAVSEGWPMRRLGTIERSVLRLAVVELESLPAPVVIDEAVRLTKRYATDEAAKLVNGVLGRIAEELRQGS